LAKPLICIGLGRFLSCKTVKDGIILVVNVLAMNRRLLDHFLGWSRLEKILAKQATNADYGKETKSPITLWQSNIY
uniref:hypothetical protein n=1 Tax=Streptococcus suis TaxID=1307 RepID=UPI000515B069